jgi:hypothetical protein
MIHHIFTKKGFYNKKLSDYCMQSTNLSIQRLLDVYNTPRLDSLDKNKQQLIVPSQNYNYNNDDEITPNNFTSIIIFISISSMLYFFFNSIKSYQSK